MKEKQCKGHLKAIIIRNTFFDALASQLLSEAVTGHSKYRSEYEILTSTVGQLKSQMSDVKKVKSQR